MRNEAVAVLAVACLLVLSMLSMPQSEPEGAELVLVVENGSVKLTYDVPPGSNGYPATVLIMPLDRYSDGDVLVVQGAEAWERNDTAPASVQGLIDHLAGEFRTIGSLRKAIGIDQDSLLGTIDLNDIIVLTYDLKGRPQLCDSLEQWVREGGTIVCIGPTSIPFKVTDEGRPELELELLDYDSGEGSTNAAFLEALGLRAVAPRFAIPVQDITASGGMVIGPTYGRSADLTTMGLLRVGNGSVLLMGGPIEAPFRASMEDVVAWDLARCIEVGVPWAVGGPSYARLQVEGGGSEGVLFIDDTGAMYSAACYNLDDAHRLFSRSINAP